MKTIVKAAGVVTAVALSLTACSNPGPGRNDGGAGVTADGTAKVKAKELTVWTNAADTPAIRDVYKRFGDKFGVKMNIVSISADAYESQVQTKWASGDRPDILEYHATSLFWALNPAKNLVDMSRMPYVAKSGKIYDVAGSLEGEGLRRDHGHSGADGHVLQQEALREVRPPGTQDLRRHREHLHHAQEEGPLGSPRSGRAAAPFGRRRFWVGSCTWARPRSPRTGPTRSSRRRPPLMPRAARTQQLWRSTRSSTTWAASTRMRPR
ncbi:hypothetical protein SGRIM119S_02522 [Streptomyces griseorubiginosus]